MWFVRLFYNFAPALLAIASGFAFLLWVFGASGVSGTPLAEAWGVGFWALLLYPAACQTLIIAAGICRWAKWPVAELMHQLTWVATIIFVAVMLYVASQFGWIG